MGWGSEYQQGIFLFFILPFVIVSKIKNGFKWVTDYFPNLIYKWIGHWSKFGIQVDWSPMKEKKTKQTVSMKKIMTVMSLGLVSWHINLFWLFNAKVILLEEQ